ncbi:24172_t:CDS:1 [Cetraspora pellucida]|uniref:24172_t:CDS:1 n=1 Tax=Cetraspora pellucida TaxID=1433469 RepID=A0A9N9H647_9GLOM|nr:24172_t:CDS:1 [Cetraspora pellucida]
MLAKPFVFVTLVALSIISIGFVLSGLASPLTNDSPQLLKRNACSDGHYYKNRIMVIPCNVLVKDCILSVGRYVIPHKAIRFHKKEIHVDLNQCDGFNYRRPFTYVTLKTHGYGIHRLHIRPTHTSYEYSESHSSSSSSSSHSNLHVSSDSDVGCVDGGCDIGCDSC